MLSSNGLPKKKKKNIKTLFDFMVIRLLSDSSNKAVGEKKVLIIVTF